MVIGITGGVGCGKSTVMAVLREHFGAKTILADELGHEALQPEKETYAEICHLFGNEIILPDGQLDRQKIAKLIYQDPKKRERMNAIVHPFVKKQIENLLLKWKEEPLVAIETAIMFETGCDAFCDQVWHVKVGREIRIQRLMQSRGYTREKAESIMAAQMPEEESMIHCVACVENEGTVADLETRLQELLCI